MSSTTNSSETADTNESKGDRLSSRRTTIEGSAWIAGGTIASIVVRFFSNLILTRMISPDQFGLVTLVVVVMHGLELFSDVGIGPAIVQNDRDDDDFLNTAWTLQVIRGFVMWTGGLLIAAPMAIFYDKPIYFTLIPVACLSAVVSGFNSTALHTARRNFALRRLAVVELLFILSAVLFTITLAWNLRSVWALVLGPLCGSAVKLVLSYMLLPHSRNRFCWDPQAARSILHFGKWIILNSGLNFLTINSDKLYLGKMIPMGVLGVYHQAVNLSQPAILFNYQLSRYVCLPLFSRTHREQAARLSAVFYQARLYVDLFQVVIGLGIALAVPAVKFLFPEAFHGAGPLLSVLLIRASMRCIVDPIDSFATAVGYPSC